MGGRTNAQVEQFPSGVSCARTRSAEIDNAARRVHERQAQGCCAARRVPAGNGQSMAVGSARRLTARITDERLGVYDYTPTNKKIHKKMVKICIVSPREENLTKNWSKSVCAYRKET